MVAYVAVDSCDTRVIKGTRRFGSTARSLQMSVPTIAWAWVMFCDVAGGEASDSGAYWMRWPYAGTVPLCGAYCGRLGMGCCYL
jgi:hypothetical protein